MSSIKVIKYIIKSTPVGELGDVLDDLQNIVGQDFINNSDVRQALREYYETHKQHFPYGDEGQTIVTAAGRQEPIVTVIQTPIESEAQQPQYDEEGYEIAQEQQQPAFIEDKQVEEFVYYDPVKRIRFSFHPVTLETKLQETDVYDSLPADVVQLRDEVVQAMDQYLSRQYRKGTTTYTIFTDGQNMKVEISCHNLNFKNYWGGEWQSTWDINLGQGAASGSIQIHNHYFEQGNIQFNMQKEIASSSLKGGANAKTIVDFISRSESNYQEGLDEMYTEVSEKLLKGMRRIIPVTRTKFDWGRPVLM